MNITKTLRKLVVAVNANVEEDSRTSVYEALLESFEEEDFVDLEVSDLMGICPYFDDVLVSAQPDLFDAGDFDDDESGYVDDLVDDEWSNDEE